MRRMLSVAVAAAIASLIVIPVAAAWAWPADGPVLRPFSLAEDRYAAGQHRPQEPSPSQARCRAAAAPSRS